MADLETKNMEASLQEYGKKEGLEFSIPVQTWEFLKVLNSKSEKRKTLNFCFRNRNPAWEIQEF